MRPSKRMREEQEDCGPVPDQGEATKKTINQSADDIFDTAVSRIAKAAKQFKDVVGDNPDEAPSFMSANEENPYSAKIPAGAYCLRLAHQIWRDTRTEAARQSVAEGFDDEHAGVNPDCPVHGQRAFAVGTLAEPEMTTLTPEAAIVTIAEELSSEQRNGLIACFKAMNAREGTPPKTATEENTPLSGE